MLRKWILAVLGGISLAAGITVYHLFVLDHSRKHYRGLLESPTIAEKKLHYDEIHRFPHPWNPYREKAERWFQEEGHEWEFLREGGGGTDPAKARGRSAAAGRAAGDGKGG